MEPMTVAALRQALADLPDDTEVIDAATGHALVDIDLPDDQVELLFLDTQPRRRRTAVNNFVGELHGGSLMQVGGDYRGDLHL